MREGGGGGKEGGASRKGREGGRDVQVTYKGGREEGGREGGRGGGREGRREKGEEWKEVIRGQNTCCIYFFLPVL